MGKGECAVGCQSPGCQGCFVDPAERVAALERENAEFHDRAQRAEAALTSIHGNYGILLDEALAAQSAAESSLSALAREAGELVDALPQCDNEAHENRPATHWPPVSYGRWDCDDCAALLSRGGEPAKIAAPLRALVARLAALKGGGE